MSVVYEEKISFNVHLHSQMSVKTSKCPFLRTFDPEFEAYNIEIQIYGQMSIKTDIWTFLRTFDREGAH